MIESASHDWLGALMACRERQQPCVLVTVIAADGTVARGIGSKMLVTKDSLTGSVGGSHSERQAILRARDLLTNGGQTVCETVANEAQTDHCTGSLTLLYEPLFLKAFHILLFGAGHVGKALIHILTTLDCQVTWVDSRAGMFPEQARLAPNINTILADSPQKIVQQAPAGSYYLLMSHSHERDFEIGEAILLRNNAAFFGMIGSSRKRQQFERRMVSRGYALTTVEQHLTCPLGLPGLTGQQPAEIAVAIAAQLLQKRDQYQTASR